MLEKEAKPLGFVTFFDPAVVGIKVATAEGGVRVKEAEKGKLFAIAGLGADDLVTAIDSTAVKDAAAFCRLLRAKLAVDGEMVFKVRRGDKVSDIAVKHKE
ncbi:MAG TPA: PDZ domain-containing protein [Gemmataceae bacterium]|nr:PDZ domain-containing protein [Gemmataceae bacterium]